MQLHHTISSLHQALQSGRSVALVPTMGNLHDGHLSLVRQAATLADSVVVSIFVNPLQFGPNEDFDSYPRTLQADCDRLRQTGVDHVFAPSAQEMYPCPQTFFAEPPEFLVNTLEGANRPGHFRGVATVVLKLINIVRPHYALFGKKDYQQFLVLKHMAQQFCLPVTLLACDTVRATDELALSSRNSYLSAAQRAEAPRLQQIIQQIKQRILQGETDFLRLEQQAMQTLKDHGWQPDYVAIRCREDLSPPQADNPAPLIVLAAARLGKPRLLDNLEI